MRWLANFSSRIRRGPLLGGDAVRDHIANVTGAAEPFGFDFDELTVLAHHVDAPIPHVLYTTFGLSRVQSSVPVAGTQTELTMRVPADSPVPYAWPAERLATMVTQIRRTGNDIEPGHYMRLARPAAPSAVIEGFTFVVDPVLGVIDTPTGTVRFTYAVGLTARELEAALSWDPMAFTGVLGEYVPLGITDPSRADVHEIPEAKARAEAGARVEGSSISAVHAKLLDIDETGRVDMDPASAQALLRAARFRLPHGKSFALLHGEHWLRLSPGASYEAPGTHLQLPATRLLIDEISATFDPTPGTYTFRSAPLTIHVVDPTS